MGVLDELEARKSVTVTATIYMDTAAVTEVLAMRDELRRVKGNELPGLRSESAVFQRRLEEAEVSMLASERVFEFRALSDTEYEALVDAHPDSESGGWDVATFPTALIAGASHDPVLSLDEAERVRGLVTNYEWDSLFAAAFKAQNEKPRPFTGHGTERIIGSVPNSTIA